MTTSLSLAPKCPSCSLPTTWTVKGDTGQWECWLYGCINMGARVGPTFYLGQTQPAVPPSDTPSTAELLLGTELRFSLEIAKLHKRIQTLEAQRDAAV